jgi:DNA-binding CsgD family transcriptional regulator
MAVRLTIAGRREMTNSRELTEPLLRMLLDTLDAALVVWNPDSSTLIYSNQPANDLLNHRGGLPDEVIEAARRHREFLGGADARGMRVPAQRCRVGGDHWFIRTVALADDLEVLVCAREVMREGDLLTELQTRHRLTNRQTDVLKHILRGTSSTDIAAALRLSLSTVYKYETELRRALDVRNNLEVMLLADGVRQRR